MGGFRSAGLWGPDYTELGVVGVETLDPHIAIALSRGKYPKGYPYLDPNEDGVLAATDGAASLIAVVDGHNGFDAAQAAMETILDAAPSLLAAADVEDAMRGAFSAARVAVAAATKGATDIRAASETGLTVAVVTPDRLTLGTLGDAQAVVIRGTHIHPVGSFAPFLGPATADSALAFDQTPLRRGDLILVATDGLFAFLGPRGPRMLLPPAGGVSPTELAGHAIDVAASGGGGDNIAVAVTAVADTSPTP